MPEPTSPVPLPMHDPWVEALVRRGDEPDGGPAVSGGRPVGRVLRLKLGYNPNSSSVGSVVTTLLWGSAVGAAMLNIAAVLVRREAAALGRGREVARLPDADGESGRDGDVPEPRT